MKHISLTVAVILTAAQPLVANTMPENIWSPPDGALTVLTTACDKKKKTLCGVIVGITSNALKPWKSQLCGEVLFWDMKPGKLPGQWVKGKVFDLTTQTTHPLDVSFDARSMDTKVPGSDALRWSVAQKSDVNCKD